MPTHASPNLLQTHQDPLGRLRWDIAPLDSHDLSPRVMTRFNPFPISHFPLPDSNSAHTDSYARWGRRTPYSPQVRHSTFSPTPRPEVPFSTFLHPNAIRRHMPKNILALFAFSCMASDPQFPPFQLRGMLLTSQAENRSCIFCISVHGPSPPSVPLLPPGLLRGIPKTILRNVKSVVTSKVSCGV
jgi:hypothetical protein